MDSSEDLRTQHGQVIPVQLVPQYEKEIKPNAERHHPDSPVRQKKYVDAWLFLMSLQHLNDD